MRTLEPSEKNLLLLLCGALFVAANMMGVRSFMKARDGMRNAIVTATSEMASDKSWIELGNSLASADTWINSHPMPHLAPDEASAQLLKSEREEAERAGLKITEENLLPAAQSAYGSTVAVSVKLTGPFEGVVKMLFALQTPTAWRTVAKLALKSDAQPPNVIAELELHQYFQPLTIPEHSPKPTTQ
jgi:Type II secretion system (T2SS), protein M subtype b